MDASLKVSVLTCLIAATAGPVLAMESSRAPRRAWLEDYAEASAIAADEGKMLLIHFTAADDAADELAEASEGVDEMVANDVGLRKELDDTVLLRLPLDATITSGGDEVELLESDAFAEMHGGPGVAVVDHANEGTPHYGRVVSAFPFRGGKYYRWRDEYLSMIPDLPPGSITQRTMVWAVREHHESPRSTEGEFSPEIAEAAAEHSSYQARVRHQGHQRWGERSRRVQSETGLGRTAEVVAESWARQTMIDSCLDCVASWRHSPGHWGQVKSRHRLFGYDLKRGRNGVWYGTGIFAD